ncbi:MAG: ribonuclease domain-containing protein [Nitrospirota bacterium]
MSRWWIIGVLVLWGLLAALPHGMQTDSSPAIWFVDRAEALESASSVTTSDRPPTAPLIQHKQAAPQKAYALLAQLQARYGKPLPGYVGGREFQNRERRLPPGHYREYDVNPKIRGHSRDAERIVIEQDTGNHYRTFMPLNETP